MKILFFSDPHVHLHKQDINRLYDCLKCLRWVFQTAVDKGIKHIVCGGDLFQDRQKIHLISYVNTFNLINQYCNIGDYGLNLWILVGNHDMWFSDKWEVSSVSPLAAINGVRIVDYTGTDIVGDLPIDFLPYTKDPVSEIKKHFSDKKSKVLVGHVAVNGADLNTYGTKAEVSVEHEGDMVKVDANVFAGWDRVFLGHYHKAQQLNGSIEYIGSPLQLNFGEAFQKKHIVILDTETMEREYVLNDFSPQHLILKKDQLDKFNLNGNFVQVLVDDIASADIVDLKQNVLKDKKTATLEFKEVKQEVKFVEHKKIDMKSGDMLESYIETMELPSCLDKKELLNIGRELCQGI